MLKSLPDWLNVAINAEIEEMEGSVINKKDRTDREESNAIKISDGCIEFTEISLKQEFGCKYLL